MVVAAVTSTASEAYDVCMISFQIGWGQPALFDQWWNYSWAPRGGNGAAADVGSQTVSGPHWKPLWMHFLVIKSSWKLSVARESRWLVLSRGQSHFQGREEEMEGETICFPRGCWQPLMFLLKSNDEMNILVILPDTLLIKNLRLNRFLFEMEK